MSRLVGDARAVIGESPLWLGNSVIWTDPVERRLLSCQPGGDIRSVDVERAVWSLACGPDGDMVGTLDDRLCTIASSGTIVAGPAAPLSAGCRLNDMATDPRSGLWAGAMHKGVLAARGAIFHAPAVGEAPILVADGLGVPNGMAFAEDGGTLFVIDTLSQTLLAYPVRDHALGEPVIVADFLALPGKPDGMTMGADGTFWVAMWGGACVAQIAADGATLRLVDVPAPHVSSLCFADEATLLVTTSRMRLSPEMLADYPGSGGLFEINLGSES
jgi:sugar lactone lactonase YvrE